MADKVKFYSYNKVCPHCVWIADDPEVFRTFGWGNIGAFYTVIPPLGDFSGVTVYDSHGFFKDTFNCVNGVKGGNLDLNHHFSNIGSLLIGATLFIEQLHIQFGTKKVRLLINSSVDLKKHVQKEHPHALITLADEQKEVDAVFRKISKKRVFPKRPVASEPYPGDTIIELSPLECSELIRSGRDAFNFIKNKISSVLKRNFDPVRENFYIFLTYECLDTHKPNCGVIRGKISVE